jgi:aldose 1-epimerase
VTIEAFGQTADGKAVHRIRLQGGGLTAKIMTWGATLQDLRLEGHAAPLTLGISMISQVIRRIRPISGKPRVATPIGSPKGDFLSMASTTSSN